MRPGELKSREFENEFIFTATRSSGPGGQNINKVNTRVELRFSVGNSTLLSVDEKEMILKKLGSKINREGELLLTSQSERSQLMNRQKVTEKFYIIVSKALTVAKKRKATRPTSASVLKRIEEKRLLGQKKNMRKQSDEY